MNEFIEQFLIECRELVEQATDDLLALEARPGDAERLDSAFRAFHTLKGGAGIVDFDAMGRALHAAEDLLARVRAGSEPISADLVGDCLTCLDQVVQWLDAMQQSGDLPDATVANAQAEAVVARFARFEPADAPAIIASLSQDWAGALRARHPEMTTVMSAFRYAPAPDSFFAGDDPIALAMATPGLVALEVEAAESWPPLAEMNPFDCHVVILGLVAEPAQRLETHFAKADQIRCIDFGTPKGSNDDAAKLDPVVAAILTEQVLMLGQAAADGLAGRIGSAGRASSNSLRALGRVSDADRLEQATAISLREGDAGALVAAVSTAISGPLQIPPEEPEIRPAPEQVRSLRVDVERVDALVALTGELTVAKNALGHAAALVEDGADASALLALLKDQHAVMDRLVGELQRSVLDLRVLPMRQVFQRFPRLIRDIAGSLGRSARLAIEGEETEADKAVVEALFEPLLHVVRNALDHGVESAPERAAAGKPAIATIRLSAARQGDRVVVEVEDDGRGLDLTRLRRTAVDRGVASSEAVASMGDDAVRNLIFAPGFSTAAAVTGLSGRGVGMDAVRNAVERLGGRVAVDSTFGSGAVVRFVLPFTVMMTRVMTVECRGQSFGIPLEAIVETVRVPRHAIVPVGGAQVFVRRDRTIPIIDLSQALHGNARPATTGEANLVVASVLGQFGAVEVDRFGERLDVMLKPMEGLLAGMPGIAGTTLMGDGRVLIVLDLQELLQ